MRGDLDFDMMTKIMAAAQSPTPLVQDQNPMQQNIPYAPDTQEFKDGSMDQKILNAVLGEQAMKTMKAPPVSQDQVKRQIASQEGDSVSMGMAAPVPMNVMNKYQQMADKDNQKVVSEYMKKREKLAKNMEERSRLLGENFKEQVNLKPLLSYMDNLWGGNTASAYTEPVTAMENERMRTGYEKAADQMYGQLEDDRMNLGREEFSRERFEYQKERDAANRQMQREALQQKRMSQGKKPLSGEAIKRLDYIVDGKDALERMRTAVKGGATLRPDIPLVGDNEFTTALRDAAEHYGRMQSGGAISKPEEQRFIKSVWKMGDSKEEVLNKIDKQFQMFDNRQTRLTSGGSQLRAQPVSNNNSSKYQDPKFLEWKKSKGL